MQKMKTSLTLSNIKSTNQSAYHTTASMPMDLTKQPVDYVGEGAANDYDYDIKESKNIGDVQQSSSYEAINC